MKKLILCGNDGNGAAEYQFGFFASRDIKTGEELTYDYGALSPSIPLPWVSFLTGLCV